MIVRNLLIGTAVAAIMVNCASAQSGAPLPPVLHGVMVADVSGANLSRISTMQAESPLPKIVIGAPNDTELGQLIENPGTWSHTHVDAIVHADHSFAQVQDSTLQQWFSAMRAENLMLELEVGAIKEWSPVGANTFQIEKPGWDRVIRLNGPVSSVVMDEPLIAARRLGKSDEYAVEQTAEFVALVRQDYPSLLVGDIEPYPAISLADHLAWINALQTRLEALGVRPLDFYRLDPDWGAFPSQGGSWKQVVTMAEQCRSAGMPFSVIYWASPEPAQIQQGTAGPNTWRNEVLAEAVAFRAAGGRADQLVVEDWIGVPPIAGPDSDSTSFIGSVRALEQVLSRGGWPQF